MTPRGGPEEKRRRRSRRLVGGTEEINDEPEQDTGSLLP